MALVNCSMDKKTVVVPSGEDDVASITLEIIPNSGYVVAARDFTAGTNPDPTKIQSITLSDSETTGGPQNDGSYTASNKVNVVVDFVDSYAPTGSITLDIDPSGEATIDYLTPVKLQGTFVVPSSPVKCTFVASNVNDYASSVATDDFYVYDNPGDEVLVMNMTIAATSGDFLNVKPTAVVTNPSAVVLDEDYSISSVETYDSNNRLTQVAYTVKTNLTSTDRSGDVVTFSGAGADIPVASLNIYSYEMNKSDLGVGPMSRDLRIYGDSGAEFRIKLERGTLDYNYDPPVFTVDSTDGEYVFDNTLETIAYAFYASGSNITYPSEIDNSGNYIASTDPKAISDDGFFTRKIVIPEDIDDIAYRITIIPEAGTTIDPNAPDIDTSSNPDVITFDIVRKDDIYIEATTSTSRSLTSTVLEYFDFDKKSRGVEKPYGRKDSEGDIEYDIYYYEAVISDNVDFHLPNGYNYFNLTDQNITNNLQGGKIFDPAISAQLKATSDGFFAGEIQSTGYGSHSNAENHEPDTAIVLTLEQRTALTNKTPFSAESFKSAFTIVNSNHFFKIKFFTTDVTPIYKSQTIEILETLDVVAGEENHQNVTAISSPPVDRSKLYLSGSGLTVKKWGDSNMSIAHNLDTFAFTTDQTSVVTLDMSIGITHTLKNFLNDIASEVGYVEDLAFSQTMLVSNDNEVTYVNSNITTNTTHVKFNISGAYLVAGDKLPPSYNINDYQMLFQYAGGSPELSTVQLSITSAPTVSLTNGASVYRKLTISNFEVIIDFNGTLTSLNAGQEYLLSAAVIHQLSQQYKSIDDIEADYGEVASDL